MNMGLLNIYACIYIYIYIYLFSFNKVGNPAICDNKDDPRGRYAQWNKPDRRRQILHEISSIWNLKRKEEREGGKVEMVVPWGWPVGGQGEWEVGKKLVKVYNFQL